MKLIILSILLSFTTSRAANPNLSELRNLLSKAPNSKSSWIEMAKLLAEVDNKSPAVLVCYKGVSNMMEAKYVISPWSKLSSFKKGKKLIEEAVKKDARNLEIRFLRYSVQTNIPAFLDYNDDKESDKQFILANVGNTKDKELKNNIVQYLRATKACTEEELKRIQK